MAHSHTWGFMLGTEMLILYNVQAKSVVLTGKGGMHFLRKSTTLTLVQEHQAGWGRRRVSDQVLSFMEVHFGMLGGVYAWLNLCRCVSVSWVRDNVSHVTASHLRLSCAVVTKTLNVSAACNSGGFLLFYEVCVRFRLTSCFLHPLLSKTKAWRGSSHLGGTELVMFQEGGPLAGPKSGLSSNTRKWAVQGDAGAGKALDCNGKGLPGWRAGGSGDPGGLPRLFVHSLGFYGDGISLLVVSCPSLWIQAPS